MSNVVSLYENEDYRLRIELDDYPDDPRSWDNLSVMVCWHRRYRLGDKHDYRTPDDFYFALAEEVLLIDTDKLSEMDEDEIEWLVLNSDEIIIKPLYLYDHSGITISTSSRVFSMMDSAGWDWGQVGWVYVTMKKMRENFKDLSDDELRQRAEEIIKHEVQVYDDYLRGNVYYFILEKKIKCDKCHHIEYEVIDSCGGFYGDDYEEQIAESLGPEYQDLLRQRVA